MQTNKQKSEATSYIILLTTPKPLTEIFTVIAVQWKWTRCTPSRKKKRKQSLLKPFLFFVFLFCFAGGRGLCTVLFCFSIRDESFTSKCWTYWNRHVTTCIHWQSDGYIFKALPVYCPTPRSATWLCKGWWPVHVRWHAYHSTWCYICAPLWAWLFLSWR